MPLSYVAILGGTLTLVGTSTNLLVNSIYVESTAAATLGIFEFAKFGIIMLLIGLTYVLFAVPFLIPSRTVTSSLTQSYHMGGYLTELKISHDSPLVGKTCQDRAVNKNYDITVLDILRDGKLISRDIRDSILQKDDILFVRGSLENFLRMKEVEKGLASDQSTSRIAILTAMNIADELFSNKTSSTVDTVDIEDRIQSLVEYIDESLV